MQAGLNARRKSLGMHYKVKEETWNPLSPDIAPDGISYEVSMKKSETCNQCEPTSVQLERLLLKAEPEILSQNPSESNSSEPPRTHAVKS